MYTARDIAKVFEAIAPQDTGVPGDQLGFIFGDPDQEVKGVACVWNVHARSLRESAALGVNMLICHEGIWLPEQKSPWYDGPKKAEIFSYNVRRELLEEHRMVVYRSHSNWDALPSDGVPDQAVAALGIENLRVIARQKFFSVHELPRDYAIKELMEQVRRGLGYSGCRAFGDENRHVRRFAFLIGGFGENQFHMPQAARDLGAEAVIIGEMSEFIVIAALEMGLPVIESLHSASEIPAIRRQAAMLSERLPGLPIRYVPSGALAFQPDHGESGG